MHDDLAEPPAFGSLIIYAALILVTRTAAEMGSQLSQPSRGTPQIMAQPGVGATRSGRITLESAKDSQQFRTALMELASREWPLEDPRQHSTAVPEKKKDLLSRIREGSASLGNPPSAASAASGLSNLIAAAPPTPPAACTALLAHYGLCEASLLRLPAKRFYTAASSRDHQPFMFLHLSKCAAYEISLLASSCHFLPHTSYFLLPAIVVAWQVCWHFPPLTPPAQLLCERVSARGIPTRRPPLAAASCCSLLLQPLAAAFCCCLLLLPLAAASC